MAVITKARTLSTSGTVRPTQHVFRQRGTQPVAALVSARRNYWTSPSSKSKDHGAATEHGNVRPCSGKVLHRYVKHRDGLQYSYIDGLYRGRLQATRSSSNWAPEDKHDEGNKSKGKTRHEESPWDIQRRAVRERMQRRLEAHLSMLRKDPYWGLFGSSEERGVWNPWNTAQETLQRRKGEAWEESAKPTKPAQTKSQEAPPSRQPDPAENDYIYDPISNKRVRRPSPDTVSTKPPTSKRAAPDQVIDFPVKKFQSATGQTRPNKDHTRATFVPDTDKLVGFARQPWLLSEGFLDSAASRHVKVPEGSAFEKWRQDNEGAKRNAEAKKKAEAEALARQSQTQQHQSQSVHAQPTERANSAPAYPPYSAPAKLKTSLYRSLQSGSKLRYDESFDRRENLDQLRPDAIRAAVAKPAATAANIATKDSKQRREFLERVATSMFESREERLNREFAANKWDLKRNLSAYPGDFPKTPEELRARRQLLEKSFATSTDVIELHLAKALDPSKPASLNKPIAPVKANTVLPESGLVKTFMSKALDMMGVLETQLKNITDDAGNSSEKQKSQQHKLVLEPDLVKTLGSTASELVGVLETRLKTGTDKALDKSEKQKAQQRELVREIQSIYESTYGIIDTKHRQPSVAEAKSAKASTEGTTAKSSQSTSKAVQKPTARPNLPAKENKLNEPDVSAHNAAGTKIQKPQNMLPVVKPGTQFYPFDNARELDSASELLEASVRDFERIMATNTKKPLPPPTLDPNPHISDLDAELLKPVSQDATDRLTAELAEIAADVPGVVQHKEPVSKPQSYVLLSYSRSAGNVQVIKTTSSIPESGANNRTVHSILSRLDSPGKYFDHMSKLEQAGYELVAGGRKMLIYRDTKEQSSELPWEVQETAKSLPKRDHCSPDDKSMTLMDRVWENYDRNRHERDTANNKAVNQARRRVRRVEDTFSGTPPRYESERIAEEISESMKRRDGPVWRLLKYSLVLGTLFYSFGVTLEWLKDNERRKLITEYQQEVKRVQEVERRKAQEQSKGFGWGF